MLLLHHLPIVFAIRQTKRKTQAVEKASVQKSLGPLFAHAITRCHTTSKLLGIGKRHSFEKTHERPHAKVNNPRADKNNLHAGEDAFLSLYGCKLMTPLTLGDSKRLRNSL